MTHDTRHTTHVARHMSYCVLLCLVLLCPMKAFASVSDIEAAIMEKNYEQARSLAEKDLKTTTNSKERAQIQYYLGLSQLRLGQYPQARSVFGIVMSSMESQDLYDRAAIGMVEVLYVSGFYKDALLEGQKLLIKSPHSSFLSIIYLKLARTHLKLTQWKQAKEYFQKIINDFPQSVEASIAKNLMEEKEYFAVQVGSFLDQEKAQKLMEQLKAGGQYAYIIETVTNEGKKFFRVRVGQLTSLSDAQSLEAKLAQLGYPTLIYP